MAGDTVITLIGNLTDDPEMRFTPSGAGVANFTIASTPRSYDQKASEWKDGETLFMRCAIWREAAENVAESLKRGMRVVATGRLQSRTFDTKEGEKRTVIELQVDEIGPSLKNASAKVTKNPPSGGGGQQQPRGGSQGSGGGGWGGGAPQQSSGGWGGSQQPAAKGAWG
jgi:single-strand DNA-binding protein